MGEYEKERDLRAERRKKRRRRQRIRGILILLVFLLLLAAAVCLVVAKQSDLNFSGMAESVKSFVTEDIPEFFTEGELVGKVKEFLGMEKETEPQTTEAVTETERQTEPPVENHDEEIAQADLLASQYDYDGAIAVLKGIGSYASDTELQNKVAGYEQQKAACVPIGPEDVTHIFYHSLVVDPARAFDPNKDGYAGWQQWMTTVTEFDRITQSMYDRGYVLVSIHDLINKKQNSDGTVTVEANQILLPPDKKAYVMSLDDLSYYHTYDGRGVAAKLVLNEEGKPVCEYIQGDGTTVYGAYDVVPRMDAFIEEHPDASYRGAKGIIALTGYNGVLGYRTDGTYSPEHNTNTEVYYTDDLQQKWLDAHPDYDFEKECEEAKKVADAMKADGWEFASHTWGHKEVGDAPYDELVRDTERWMQYVAPIVGTTDTIIFAHGQDIAAGAYTSDNAKYTYLKSKGFDIFCNVDSTAYQTSVTSEYLHQGRRNLDGYRIYQDAIIENPKTADLFDANEVLDPDRPLPVPDLGNP